MEPGSVIAERFEIERRVSAGGMSAVYRARDLRMGGVVAVKVLYGRDEGEHRERLYREARVLEKLSHPGIVRYVAHGEVEIDKPYLAMEWITGETLGKRLARTGLTMGESVRVVQRVAETLAVTHAKGILHRDIKPGNLILRESNVDDPVLIDFGIARMGLGPSSITNTGVMLGTLGYMAPEQARGTKPLDARADVFALGAVLFKCLTGLPAFAGEDEIAVLAKMLFETPPRVRDLRKDVPAALDELLSRMLSRDPLQRPAGGGLVAAELAALGQLDDPQSAASREVSTHRDVITRGEQRLVSVVAVASHTHAESEESTIVDGTWQGMKSLSKSLRAAIQPFGAQLESLASGMIVATLPGRHSATDQATRAARCVLAMRVAAPNVPMVLATGRAVLDDRVPIGDTVDRAIRMLQQHQDEDLAHAAAGKKQPIHIDEVTAGLLDSRFVVKGGPGERDGGLELVGEQVSAEEGRMLLGKPTPCVGRERELVMLEGVFAECVSDDVARAVLVTAPAGVGKSRLRHELLRTLRHRGVPHEVWMSRGDPMRAGSPFGMLSQIIRAAADAQDNEPPRVQREKIRARVSRVVSQRDLVRVTQFLSETLGVSMPEEDDVQLRAARHDPILMGDQMRRAFEHWLAAECADKPVVLVFEDLHWGDLPSVNFVDSALRTLHDRPLMVLALARPEVKDLFPDLFVERGVQELRLKELSKKASERLVRQVLGEQLDDELVAQLVSTAGGNAFYLEELIRSASPSSLGERAPGGQGARQRGPLAAQPPDGALNAGSAGRRSMMPVVLPETVLTMVQARLEALEPEARRVLRAASIFGQTFWRGGVIALLDGTGANDPSAGVRPSAGLHEAAQVSAWLDELAVREIVTRREQPKFRSEVEYVFRHAFIAEAAYGMLTDKDRAIGHKLAAAWLEEMGESEAVVLAEHLERGGEPKRAITFYRRAAAQALEGNDLEACVARADRGVACGAEGEVLGRLLLRKAEAHRWRGELQQGKECARAALALLPHTGRRWFLAAGETVEACARLGDESELHRAVDELCEVSSAGTLTAPHLVALTRAACVLMAAGNYPSADELLRTIDDAYEVARRVDDDPLASAHVYRTRAYRALVSGDTGSALSMYNVAIAHFEAAGDMRAACRHLVNAAAACIELGSYVEAERALDDALASAQHMGLTGVSANVWHHQGMLLARLGDPRSALDRADRAIGAFAAQGDRRMEATARLYRGLFLALADDLDRAEQEVLVAIEHAGATVPLRAYGLAVLGGAHLRHGRAERAERCAREAMALLEALGGVEEGEAYVRLMYAEALEAVGDAAGAREAIATARVRILERTAMIQDPQWKDTFVEKVRENVRTLELARAWRVA